jgi:chromosomal replication initiator protein
MTLQPCTLTIERGVSATKTNWGYRQVRDKIISVVEYHFGVSYSRMSSRSRLQEIVDARHACMYLMRMRNYKVVFIGNVFNRDHSTVLTACQSVRNRIDTDERYRADISYLESLI